MPGLRDELSGIDRLIHEPARLVILTALSACPSADFQFLQHLTGLTSGNLSSHLARLEEAGLVTIEKKIVGKYPNTRVGLSETGRERIHAHWKQLDHLHRRAVKEGRGGSP